MQLPKFTQFAFFSIMSPRYRDRVVLLKASKVANHNKVIFTDSPSMGMEPYYISGSVIKKCKKEKLQAMAGHTLDVYAVPIDRFEPLELVNDIREVV